MTWREWFTGFLRRGHDQTATMAETWATELHRSGLSEDTPRNRESVHVYMARLRERFPHTIRPVIYAGWHGTEFCFTDGSRAAVYPALPGRVYFAGGEAPPQRAPELGEVPSVTDRVTMMVQTGAMLDRMSELSRKRTFADATPYMRVYLEECLAVFRQRRS